MTDTIRRFVFGTERTRTIMAPTLERAVLTFRVSTLYPHNYSTSPVWLGDVRDVALSSAPGAVIHIRERDSREILTSIPIEDTVNDAAPDLARVLADADGFVAPESGETQIAVAGDAAGLTTRPRTALAERHLEIERLVLELERQRAALQRELSHIRGELDRRMEQVWFIELFLGSKEIVVPLREGAPAAVDERITVYQGVLCMDEEIAVFDLEQPHKIGEFTANAIHEFDERLKTDAAFVDSLIPAAKGIRALRVRRRTKAREARDIGSAVQNMALEAADRCTYLLVRNGERLYRLWIDVVLWPRLIPRVEPEQPEQRPERSAQAQENERKHFAAGMVAINGLLQRSTLFHPLPRADISVFDTTDVDRYFTVVHDDEGQRLLGSGAAFEHLTWKGYQAWLQSKIEPGVRVIWAPHPDYRYGHNDRVSPLERRTSSRTVSAWPDAATDFSGGPSKKHREHPDVPTIYTVEEVYKTKNWSGYEAMFMYLPGDEVYNPDRGYAQRTRRLPFQCFLEELIPIDYVSWRVLDHLLRDRGQREEYAHMLPRIVAVRRAVRAESERERHFIDLVLTRCLGIDAVNDPGARARAERLVRWWKLKTKTNRRLKDDEPKALRMVYAALKGDAKGLDDPSIVLEQVRG